MIGGSGNDNLKASAGNNLLQRGDGNDVLDAGSGDDVFVISLGRAVVKDFDLGELIQYDEGTVGSNYSLDQSGEDLLIRMNNSTASITLLQASRSYFDVTSGFSLFGSTMKILNWLLSFKQIEAVVIPDRMAAGCHDGPSFIT